MKRFLNSLTFKIGTIIILVEVVILAFTGFVYVNRFNDKIEEQVKARTEFTATLIDSGLLKLTALADENTLRRLIGEELIDMMLINPNGYILLSLNREVARKNIIDRPDMDPDWFKPDSTSSLFVETPDGFVSVTPIQSLIQASTVGTHFVYIKVGTAEAASAKRANVLLFVGVSISTVIVTSIVIILLFNSTILTRIRRLLSILERVELGDLDARVDGPLSSDEMGTLQRGVNSMIGRLAEMVGTLEERVMERSHALELSTEISRRLSTILDQAQLMAEVVGQVRSAFNYYYAQIYLFDEAHENLVLAHGTGTVGRIMLERGHSLPKGRGLVGRVAERNAQVLVPDVYRSIGVEIITQDNVADIYRRETDPEFEAQWYADWLAERFGEIEVAKQLARQKPVTDKVIQIGYVLHLLTEFTEVMKRGAEAAARDLQVELEITAPSKAYEHLPLFEALISREKDGLVVVPYGEQWPTAIQKAIKAGIPVVAANIASPLTGITNVLQSNFQSGSILAGELTKFLVAQGKQHGKIILGPGIPDRIQGFRHGMRNTNYTIIQIDESVGLSGVHSHVYWREAIEEHPDLVAAVGLMSFETSALSEIKRDSGAEWLISGYDLEIPTIEAIKDGIVQVTIGQHPYLQGYLPVLALVEHLRRGKPLEGWIAEGWLPNPLLPKTKAEMAVPIAIREEVLGVLDVQHNVVGSLTPEAVNLLQSIADQVAIGLQNARLVADLETALAETRAAYERYLEQSWKKTEIVTRRGQYHYTRPNVPALDESTLVEARQQALSESHPTTVTLNGSEASEEAQSQPAKSIVAPITLRDKTIGALHLHPASDDQEWAEDDLAVVEAVVDQLAQSAESLRLFEETRRRAGREQVIREITDKLRQAPTLEALTRTASEELSKVLGVSYSLVKVGRIGREAQTSERDETAQPESGSS
jgi:ABC-type sugar transport system substrate-binding protein/HAMP domain-containing protein